MARGKYAENTDVTWERSRNEIERNLKRYGASKFMYGTEETRAMVAFEAQGRRIRFVLPLPDLAEARRIEVHKKVNQFDKARSMQDRIERTFAQTTQQRWRALNLVILAKLEAIASGVATFEDEFLPYTVLPNGQTVGEWAKTQLVQIGTEHMPPMLPGARA